MKIFKNGPQIWNNLHQTYSQPVSDIYDLRNEQLSDGLAVYNDTTAGIQGVIAQCIRDKVKLRALGGNWSFTPIASSSGIILNTKLLNGIFSVTPGSVASGYAGESGRLCFAQCGASIWELHAFLRKKGLSLSACGASNGQTIAGAIATGTHGAAIGFGATQDAVVGLHIITAPDRHVWLERKSYPVVSDQFVSRINAVRVSDDALFEAALVSFGSFGFIHGVMLETEPDFLLQGYLRRVKMDTAYYRQITTLDFNYDQLPFPGEMPYHFQTAVNPYDPDGGAYMTTMYKRPLSPYVPPKPNGAGIGPGDDAAAFIGKVADFLPASIPLVVNKVLARSLTPYEAQRGRLGEIFSNTTLRGKVASAAVGIPYAETGRAMKLVLDVNKKEGPFAGLFAFRFVKASRATMAFTRFAPVTCVLELDGVNSEGTRAFYEACWNALEKANIPHAFHWGKMNSLKAGDIKRIYGSSLDRFLAAREQLLDPATRSIFSNKLMVAWGIDNPQPAQAERTTV